jgi:hypothetical protein
MPDKLGRPGFGLVFQQAALPLLGMNSIQITPLGVIRIGDIRCHQQPLGVTGCQKCRFESNFPLRVIQITDMASHRLPTDFTATL